MNRRFAVLGCALFGLLMIVPACDSSGLKLAPVTGTVTYKNAPLKAANVKFIPENGPMAIGMTDDEGNFKLTTNGRPGAVVGPHKVAITKMTGGTASSMPSNPKPEDMMKMQKEQMGRKASGPKSEIPEAYANPDSSKLTADVSANGADNTFTFPLQ